MASGYNKARGKSGWGFGSLDGSWSGSTTRGRKNSTLTRTSVGTSVGTSWAPGYGHVAGSFLAKINSYKTLVSQAKGPASYVRPSATTLNSFANWVTKGANVFTLTTAQLTRWCGRSKAQNQYNSFASINSCKNFLSTKFGRSTIKAVARTKSGSWMIAAAPTVKGRPFHFPH